LKWLLTFWRWLVRRVVGDRFDIKSAPYRTVLVDEALPAELVANTLYVVNDDGFLEQAAMLCPCGCQRTLHMNLLPDDRPCWRLTQHADGTASLFPSVWRQKDCGSHFWFREGKVIWCVDDPNDALL
jgi:Family of unknown function (DUF6527)